MTLASATALSEALAFVMLHTSAAAKSSIAIPARLIFISSEFSSTGDRPKKYLRTYFPFRR
jgi:hypothetical protein